ncbi:MAG: hypothetical protein COB14_07720 [Alphaproteobacteria bacterium]|nr:MAG: hypothetical protein COB14_07720 [Alphaproteobacteria bacterium]
MLRKIRSCLHFTKHTKKNLSDLTNKQDGNIFFMLFGAVAVVGLLGTAVMSTMRGPLSTMVEIQSRTQAESEMAIASRLALLEATELASDGDCDGDGFVEPLEFADAGGLGPVGGGFLPNEIASSHIDPWGTEYGYCAWDAGAATGTLACDIDSSGINNRSDGNSDPTDETYTIIAIISAGPDQVFGTTCTGGATPSIAKTGDDMVVEYTYASATSATNGLWHLQSGDPTIAAISKNLEITGEASFSAGIDLTGSSEALALGAASMLFPNQGVLEYCTSANNGLIRINTSADPDFLELCDDPTGWVTVGGSGLWTANSSNEIYFDSAGTTEVGIGTTSPDHTLDIDGTLESTGAVDFGSTLNVAGAGTFQSSVSVAGSYLSGTGNIATISGTVSGNILAGNTLLTGGDASIGGTLGVAGAVDFDSTLNVDGISTLANVNAQATTVTTLNATDAVDFDTTLNVDGTSTLADVNAQGTISNSSGNVDIGDTVDISETLNITQNLNVTGDGDIDGTLEADDYTWGGNDFTPETCASGRFNRWDGSSWVCEDDTVGGGGGGSSSLNALSDVAITSPVDGSCLTYDNGSGDWIDTDCTSTTSAGIFENASNVIRVKSSAGDYATDDFVFGSPQLDDDGDNDHRTRMFFDTSKAAFRAGAAAGTHWDDANVGGASTAFGYNTRASGFGSVALGASFLGSADASGINSFVMGASSRATGAYSFSFGLDSYADGNYSFSFGNAGTSATGDYSKSFGLGTRALGDYSSAQGRSVRASGENSTAIGYQVVAGSGTAGDGTGDYAIAYGLQSTTQATDPVITGDRSMVLFFDGDVTDANSTYDFADSDKFALIGGELQIGETQAQGAAKGCFRFNDTSDELEYSDDCTTYVSFTSGIAGLWTDLGGGRIHYGTTSANQIGVGTSNPQTTLDVNGGIRVGSVSGGATPTFMNLGDLGDTDTSAQADNTCLVYQISSSTWEAIDCATAAAGSDVFQVTANVVNTVDVNAPYTTADFVFGSPQLDDDGDANHDNRMFFDKSKGAFRVGTETGTNWDDANVGTNSIALGRSANASGNDSAAMGAQVTASGLSSFAIGLRNTAGGQGSFALGIDARATNTRSIAIGNQVTTSGQYSLGFGLGGGAGTDPTISGFNSLGIFMGDQSGVNLAVNNRMGLYGGDFLIDDDGTAGSQGCIRYTEGTGLEFSDDCTTFTAFTDAGNGSAIFEVTGGAGSEVVSSVDTNAPYATADFVFGSPQLDDDGDANHDNRMFFDKSKGAFRAGSTFSTQWDNANVGTYSFAVGKDTTASSLYDFAVGEGSVASGSNSFAVGTNAIASNYQSFALGENLTTSGAYSFGFGTSITVSGDNSVGLGLGFPAGTDPIVSGDSSFGIFMGDQSGVDLATANRMGLYGGDFLIDDDGTVGSQGCIRYVEGTGLEFSDDCATYATFASLGFSLWTDNTTHITRENTHILDAGATMTTAGFDAGVSGFIFHTDKNALRAGRATGNHWQESSIGAESIALGADVTASGQYSIALGFNADATGYGSFAWGYNSNASGNSSIAYGGESTASGYNSMIFGKGSTASGSFGLAIGTDVTAAGDYSLAFGAGYNIDSSAGSDPAISGDYSIGFFMGDQSGVDLTDANTMAILGGDFIVGSYQLDDTGTGSQDNRMFFDTSKGAFRAGGQGGTEWDDASVGNYSAAFGQQTLASASNSFSAGFNTNATGSSSTVFGNYSTASGGTSFAAGNNIIASGDYAVALGHRAQATAFESFAFGLGTPSGATPIVSAANSFGIFMGDQSGVNLAVANRMGLYGGDFLIDDDGTAGSQGCIRYTEGTGLEYSHDCSTYSTMGNVASGVLAIDDLSDAYTDYATDNNLIMGRAGAAALTSGATGNIFIGKNTGATSGNSTATTDANTAIGYSAMNALTSGSNNAAIGAATLTANTTGSDNTALGSYALNANTTADNNTAIGRATLAANTTGQQNTGTGSYVLATNIIGNNNTAHGYAALNANLGDNNSAFGSLSLYANTSGAGNTATGYAALSSNLTADNNTASGFSALSANTTGTANTASGAYTMINNTVGSANTATGGGALFSNVAKSANTAIGQEAMRYADDTTTPSNSYNTAIGHQSLYGSVTAANNTGINNTAIGAGTLLNTTSGSNNVALGFQVGDLNTTGSNNILIGYDVDAPTATTSDHLNIGNLIYGDLANGDFIVGSYQLDDTATGSQDNRMFFDASKGAFRAGSIDGTQWDDANVGANSIAMGEGVTASGTNSIAIGYATTANGLRAVALGANNTSSGAHSFTATRFASASGQYGVAMGYASLAQGDSSISLGRESYATGDYSFSFGLGDPAGTRPVVSGVSSFGIFMGDQSGVNLAMANRMGLYGGDFLIDDDGTAGSQGCIRYTEGTGLEFSHDCSTYATMGAVVSGTLAIDDLSDGYTDYVTDHNMFLGNTAGNSILAGGNNNVFIGEIAGEDTTSGSYNIFIGREAGRNNITGAWNTFVGDDSGRANTSGSYNTGFGGYSLRANIGGQQNTAIGDGTLEVNTSGGNNTALGRQALFTSGTGNNNVALGRNALHISNGASNNTVIGTNAGDNITTGSSNIIIGYGVDAPSATGDDQLNIGDLIYGDMTNGYVGISTNAPLEELHVRKSDAANTPIIQVQNDAAFGAAGLRLMRATSKDGTAFVAFGNGNTAAEWNIGIRNSDLDFAIWDADTGDVNRFEIDATTGYVGIGDFSSDTIDSTLHLAAGDIRLDGGAAGQAGCIRFDDTSDALEYSDDCSTYSTFASAGANAINDLTDAITDYATDNNMFIGQDAGTSIASGGIQNLFIGQNSGTATTTGDYNTAIGYNTLAANIIGTNNSATGNRTLEANTTGIDNTAMGDSTMRANTIGSSNTAIGNSALRSNVAKSRNTAIGYQSMFYADNTITASNSNNTAIGYQALYGSTTAANNTGINNTSIGANTMLNNTSGGHNIALGYQAGDLNTTGSDNILIGYGIDAPTATTSNHLNIGGLIYGDLANGVVMFGTTDSTDDADYSDPFMKTANGLDVWYRTFSNNTGIKTDIDFQKAGGTEASPIAISDGHTLGGIRFSGYDGDSWENRAGIYGEIDGTVSNETVPTALTFNTGSTSIAERMRISAAGDIGIGTDSPTDILTIVGDGQDIHHYSYSNTSNYKPDWYGYRARGTEASPTIVQDGDLLAGIGGYAYDGNSWELTGQIWFEVNGTPANESVPTDIVFLTGLNSAIERMRIDSNGDIIMAGRGALTLHSGATAVRPSTPVNGMIRYNTDNNAFEGYENSTWTNIIGGGGLWTDNTTHVTRENFHVLDTGLAAGSTTAGTDGDGTYAFYDPDKGAMRGGAILSSATSWQDANIGTNSFAWGANVEASGTYSTALGFVSTASGYVSTALGYGTTASGDFSTSIGYGSESSALYSFASGRDSTASGERSTALGQNATAAGYASFAAGRNGNASGYVATTLGNDVEASGDWGIAFGNEVRVGDGTIDATTPWIADGTPGEFSVAYGLGAPAGTHPQVSGVGSFGIFMGDQSGYDLTTDNRMALVGGDLLIDDDGTAGSQGCIRYVEGSGLEFSDDCTTFATLSSIAGGAGLWTDNTTHVTRESFHILDAGLAAGSTTAGLDGNGTYAFFDPDKGAFRGGNITSSSAWQDTNVGSNSLAWGYNTEAAGSFSFATGWTSNATGESSVAMGSAALAAADNTIALGMDITVSGVNSMGLGLGDAAGTAPIVSGTSSFGIFMGDQSGYDLTDANTFSIMGASGGVGIGTVSPDADGLHIDTGGVLIRGTHSGASRFLVETTGGDATLSLYSGAQVKQVYFDAGSPDNFIMSELGVGTSTPSVRLHAQDNDANTNTVTTVGRFTHSTSGTPAAGIGAGIDFEAETTADNYEIGASIEAVSTDVTATTENFDLTFSTMAAGATASEKMRITSAGNIGIGGFSSDTIESALHIQSGDIRLDGGAANEAGCIRFDDTSDQLEYSDDCSTFTAFNAGSGANVINDLTDGYTDYATDHNLILGRSSATALTSGATENTFIGEDAGTTSANSTSTTDGNTAVGYSALSALTTGDSNTATGKMALLSNTIGDHNTAAGTNTLAQHTTGDDNTATGYQALFSSTTGAYNTATGSEALLYNRTGNYNVALGRSAGAGVINSSDISNNVFIGRASAINVLTGADNNVMIGYQAGDLTTTGSDNILIGYDVDTPTATTSDHLNIGNLIYGDLANGDFIVGSYQLDDTGTGTEDNRMFFDKSKGAFRAGGAAGTDWDNANVGNNSIGLGLDSRASGANSIALGFDTNATGNFSFAAGSNVTASGEVSIVMGEWSSASGYSGISLGAATSAGADYSVAIGSSASASGVESIALGRKISVSGANSMALGLGEATGTAPLVSGAESFGIFMGDQSGYDLTTNNRMALVGGDFLIDDDGTAGSQGCIRFVEGTGLEYSHDCTTYATMGAVASGALTIDDLSDAYTDYATNDNFFLGHEGGTNFGANNELNTAIGVDALMSLNSASSTGSLGDSNTAIGATSLTALTSGAYNTAIGDGTGESLTTGTANTVIGASALNSGTVSNRNVAIGQAAAENATGHNNTMVGALSGIYFRTGNSNTFLGHNAGRGNTTDYTYDGTENIIIGQDTAINLDNTNDQNTIIGTAAAATLTGGGSRNILLGYGVDVLTATTSDHLNIGNLIYGDLANGDFIVGSYQLDDTATGTEDNRMFFDSSKGAFRAGTVTGTEWDDGNVGSNSIAFGSGTTASGVFSAAFGSGSTASGIGSTAFGAGSTASGVGGFAAGGAAIASGVFSTAIGSEVVAGSGTAGDGNGDASVVIGLQTSPQTTDPIVTGDRSMVLFFDQGSINGNDAYNFTESDKFAIIGGEFQIGETQAQGAAKGCIRYNDTSNALEFSHDCSTYVTMAGVGGGLIDADADTQIQVEEGADDDTIRFDTAGTERMVIGSTGNVGIATTSPAATLDISAATGAYPKLMMTATDITSPDFSGSASVGVGSSTNVFGLIQHNLGASGTNTEGGMYINGITESGENAWNPLHLVGTHGGTSPTTAAVTISSQKWNGTNGRSSLSGTEIVLDVESGYKQSTTLMRLLADGSLGLGDFKSDTIASALHIQTGDIRLDGGAANQAGCIRFDDATDKLQFSNDCTAFTDIDNASIGLSDADADTLIQVEEGSDDDTIRFDTAGTERMVIDNAGNVGIGTDSPTYMLTITGDNKDFALYSHNGATPANGPDILLHRSAGTYDTPTAVSADDKLGGLRFIGYDGTAYERAAAIYAYVDTGATVADENIPAYLSFHTRSTANTDSIERMVLTSAGDLNISTASAILTLGDGSANNGTPSLDFLGDSTNKGARIQYDGISDTLIIRGLDTNKAEQPLAIAVARDTGYVGIATAIPNVALDVTGDIEYTGTITDVSDRRLKDNIVALNQSGDLLDRIAQIDTYSFTMKDDEKGRTEFGVMAQELEEIFPTLVHTADDEIGTKSVNYVGLIAPMIEATKELRAENTALKSGLDDLSQQVALLNKMAGNNVGQASMQSYLMLLLGLLGGVGLMLVLQRKKQG